MPSNGRSRRRIEEDSDPSDVEDTGPYLSTTNMSQTQAQQDQAQIMLYDLGSHTRDQITSTNAGPRARAVNQRALRDSRECNQEGTDAAKLATENLPSLKQWSVFHTDESAAAGYEVLPDLDSGNAHRMRTRAILQEDAKLNGRPLTLEDTYDDRGPRRSDAPPPARSHAGASAAFNDRGSFGRGRGGGFAGRTGPRGGGGVGREPAISIPQTRPLDPAIDPGRVYGYKDSKRKRTTAQLKNGVVTMKAAAAPSTKVKQAKAGQYKPPPRQHRPPLPEHVTSPHLAPPDDFLDCVARKHKANAEKAVAGGDASIAAPQEGSVKIPTPTMPPKPNTPTLSPAQQAQKASPRIQQIARSELATRSKSPSAYTDGQASTGSISGFSPSVNGDAVSVGTGKVGLGTFGLGISGICVPGPNKDGTVVTKPDLMDSEIPDHKKSGLTPPLRASPRPELVSITKAELDEMLKRLALCDAVKDGAMDFESFRRSLEPAQPGSTAKSAENDDSAATVSIAAGYSIGSNSLKRIIGEQPKSPASQISPSLLQSKWAKSSTKAKVSESAASSVHAPSVRDVAQDVNESQMPSSNGYAASSTTAKSQALPSLVLTEAPQARRFYNYVTTKGEDAHRKSDVQDITKSLADFNISKDSKSTSSAGLAMQMPDSTSQGESISSKATSDLVSARTIKKPVSQLQRLERGVAQPGSGAVKSSGTKKPVNPFAPRELMESDQQQASEVTKSDTTDPTKSTASAPEQVPGPGERTAVPAVKAALKKDISISRWATPMAPGTAKFVPKPMPVNQALQQPSRSGESTAVPLVKAAPKKDMSLSKWATPTESSTATFTLSSVPVNQDSAATGSILGDSNNIRSSKHSQAPKPTPISTKSHTEANKLLQTFVPTQTAAKGVTATGGIARTNAGPGLDWILREQAESMKNEKQPEQEEPLKANVLDTKQATISIKNRTTRPGPAGLDWILKEQAEAKKASMYIKTNVLETQQAKFATSQRATRPGPAGLDWILREQAEMERQENKQPGSSEADSVLRKSKKMWDMYGPANSSS